MWGGRRGLSATLTRLEAWTRDARVLAVTLAPADGWDGPLRQPGARPVNHRQVEHERKKQESRAIAAQLDAKSADMRLYLAGLSGTAPQELPEEWLVCKEALRSGAAVQIDGPAVVRAATAAMLEPPEEWVAHWKMLSSCVPAPSSGTAAVAAVPAAPCCTVCMTANQVQLCSSALDGIADTAADLALELYAWEVVFEVPPGVLTRPSGQGDSQESETAVRYLAAWIEASGARSVQLTAVLDPRDPADAELPEVMVLMVCASKQDGVPRRLALGTVLETQPWLKPLCARYRLKCSRGMDSDGAPCGLLFEPMP